MEKSKNLELIRHKYTPEYTLGTLIILREDRSIIKTLECLELPWKQNKRHISCIPLGVYSANKIISKKFGKCFYVAKVPKRSYILIHPANYVSQLSGCIAPGMKAADINNDGSIDMSKSQKALDVLLDLMDKRFILTIK